MKTLTWQKPGQQNVAQELIKIIINYVAELRFIKGPVVNWQNVRQEDGSIKVELVDMSPTKPFIGGNERFNTYCVGNFYDEDKNGVLNGVEILV